jgi:signal transduction histidine kinase
MFARHFSLKLGIASQVFVWILLALFVAFALSAVVSWARISDQASASLNERIDENGLLFQRQSSEELQDLDSIGNWLSKQKKLADLIDARDTAGLTGYLSPWVDISSIDSITLLDQEGLVLASVAAQDAFALGDNLVEQAGVKEALAGRETDGLERNASGRVEARVLVPVSKEAYPPAGVLIFSFYLDHDFLQALSSTMNADTVIVFNDRVAFSTLGQLNARPAVGQVIPAPVSAAQKQNRPSDFIELETDHGMRRFRFYPLRSFNQTPLGMYGVGVPTSGLAEMRNSLFGTFGAGLVIVVLVVGLAGLYSTRVLALRLGKLTAMTRAMAAGDMSSGVDLQHNGELGDLALAMEHLRQQLAQALHVTTLEKGRYEAGIQAMGVAAVITDENQCIVAANAAAEAMLDENRASLLGQPWRQVLALSGETGQTPFAFWSEGEASPNGAQPTIRGRFPLRSRPQHVLDIISTPVIVQDRSAGYVHILQDATATEKSVRSKDEFVLNLAHELRGPLASLRASIEMLMDDYTTLSKHDLGVLLRTLQRSVIRFQELVENLVDIGKLSAGKFRIQLMATEWNKLVRDAITQVEPLLQARGQRLDLQMAGPAPRFVLADRARIIQVIINLLINASKYGPEDKPIRLQTYSQGEWIFLEVSDRGPGISPEDQNQLFERFYRVKRMDEEGIGIGLGLALSKGIVEAHDGQIGVRSQIGQGTSFWFNLPELKPSQAEPAAAGRLADAQGRLAVHLRSASSLDLERLS